MLCPHDTHSATAEFELAVWSDPVYFGDWPASVKERNPRNLMTITPELARPLAACATPASCLPLRSHAHEPRLAMQAAALRGSFDMYMLNFYTGARPAGAHQHAATACCQ